MAVLAELFFAGPLYAQGSVGVYAAAKAHGVFETGPSAAIDDRNPYAPHPRADTIFVSNTSHGYEGRWSDANTVDALLLDHFPTVAGHGRRALTIGYAWRAVRLEGAAYSSRVEDDPEFGNSPRFTRRSTISRLSFKPSPNWTWRISRGTLGDLDQFEPNEDIRRSTVSATYTRNFRKSQLETTLAWGRKSKRMSEPMIGYLFESTLRFGRTNAIFGRLEQVGSDDIVRDDGSRPRQLFKMNKLTIGYFHRIGKSGPVSVDVGGFASRHFVPSAMASSYGSDSVSYMAVLRFKLD